MFCPKCGAQIPDNSGFCPVCGATMNEQANQPDYTTQQQAQPQYQQQAQPQYQEQAQPQYQQQYAQPQSNPAPSFMDCIKLYFKNYANFSGRSRRAEYWFVVLFQVIVAFVLSILSGVLIAVTEGNTAVTIIFYIIIFGWELACLVPSLALIVRRLHDLGKSGVYILFGLIPFAGGIILLVWEATDGSPEPNEYGYSPKYTPGFVYDKL